MVTLKRKRSWTDKQLIDACESSVNVREIIQKLGLAVAGGTYSNIQKHMKRLNLSLKLTSTERKQQGIQKFKFSKTYTDNELFSINKTVSNKAVRDRFIKREDVEYKCSICGISQWQGNPIILDMDHINGVRYDHRLHNLRLLCPNCHVQTITWGGKNKLNKNAPDRARTCKP